jgi:hypothetical protein
MKTITATVTYHRTVEVKSRSKMTLPAKRSKTPCLAKAMSLWP